MMNWKKKHSVACVHISNTILTIIQYKTWILLQAPHKEILLLNTSAIFSSVKKALRNAQYAAGSIWASQFTYVSRSSTGGTRVSSHSQTQVTVLVYKQNIML